MSGSCQKSRSRQQKSTCPAFRLTQKDEDLRYRAQQIFSAEKNLRANLRDIDTNCRGHIRIGIARQRASTMMPEIMRR